MIKSKYKNICIILIKILFISASVISIYKETGIAGYADYNSMKCIGNASKCMSTVIRDWGVTGCGIRENFEHGKYPKCPTGADGQWGLTD